MKAFLDTSVLVAAFATRGLCADVLRTVLAEHELLQSSTLLDELTRTLTEKIRVPDATVREIVTFLRATASSTESAEPVPVKVRDPDDAVILGEALSMGADVLVSGDKDLLDAAPVPGIRVLTPRQFWDLVRKGGGGR